VATDRRRGLGERGEEAVAAWYREAGYRLLAANWRCREGELDLVLESTGGETVVFCEVKTRTTSRFGTGFDAVGVGKQRRLRRLAARWLTESARTERWASPLGTSALTLLPSHLDATAFLKSKSCRTRSERWAPRGVGALRHGSEPRRGTFTCCVA